MCKESFFSGYLVFDCIRGFVKVVHHQGKPEFISLIVRSLFPYSVDIACDILRLKIQYLIISVPKGIFDFPVKSNDLIIGKVLEKDHILHDILED